MWLWNLILVDVVPVKNVTYWQAMGILILSKILFGGFSDCNKHKHSMHKKRFMHNLKNMSPEERKEFMEKWKHKFENKNWCKKD